MSYKDNLFKVCGIYCITNKLNNKQYIGQSVNIFARWHQHISMTRRVAFDKNARLHLYFAMRKYGLDNFKFEIMELCDKSELNDRERDLIHTHKPTYNNFIPK